MNRRSLTSGKPLKEVNLAMAMTPGTGLKVSVSALKTETLQNKEFEDTPDHTGRDCHDAKEGGFM
nr:hypothetical protein [Rhodoferax sp.]